MTLKGFMLNISIMKEDFQNVSGLNVSVNVVICIVCLHIFDQSVCT